MPLDKDGKASVELPTAQDARDFPSSNVTYRVSVSVTDASLREVSASGQVIATFRPFNIFTTLNCGYAPAGTPVRASITAATADGAKIAHARGTCVLQHIRADGRRETLETWDIATGKDGEASLSFQTGESGLYALSTTLEDGHGNKVEESFQFLSYGKGKQNPFKINPLSIHPDKRNTLREIRPGCSSPLIIRTPASGPSCATPGKRIPPSGFPGPADSPCGMPPDPGRYAQYGSQRLHRQKRRTS